MTFTEAAVEVLRLVGKPLHYKKITEIAIERDLLSHLGKTPETTMSSRLATMVRKDRGDAPIIKIKPGVFGLREFAPEVLDAARHESGHEYDLPEPAAEVKESGTEVEAQKELAPARPVPGADLFPEEDDDDEPILAKLADEEEEDDDDDRPRRRKRRRRRGKKRDESEPRAESRGDQGRERRSRRRDGRERKPLAGDWERRAGDGEPSGSELADAIGGVLDDRRRAPTRLVEVAEQLVRRGRLKGEPGSLVPTLAAALRGDGARRRSAGLPPRFRLEGDEVSATDWALPTEAVRAQQEALRAAARQRDLVHRAFMRRLARMPSAGLLELLATWLNAEGVVGLRGVRRPDAGPNEFALAGTLRRGPESTPLAICIVRDGSLTREKVVEVRGSLHHYGDARVAWLIGLGGVLRGAEEEAAMPGSAPVALFGGGRLAEAMEAAGVGLQRALAPLAFLDLELLEALEGPGRAQPEPAGDEDAGEGKDATDGEATAGEEDAGRKKRRRRRRRRGRGDREAPDASEDAEVQEAEQGATMSLDDDEEVLAAADDEEVLAAADDEEESEGRSEEE